MSDPVSVSATRIKSIFYYVAHVIIPDTTYALATKSFLLGKGYDGFKRWLFDFLDSTSWKHSWDCENFASAYKLYMQGLHARYTFHRPKYPASIAVGDMYYHDAKIGSHAIIVAIAPTASDQYEKIYIEPQTGEHVTLSPTEEYSTWYVGF